MSDTEQTQMEVQPAEPAPAPAPVQQQVVIVQQPGASGPGPQGAPQNVREWSSGLFSCFSDCKAFICAWCCMPCNLCDIAGRMNENCCVPLFLNGGIFAMRAKVRTQYGITGSLCNDYLATTCCTPCAVCQIDRELQHVGLH